MASMLDTPLAAILRTRKSKVSGTGSKANTLPCFASDDMTSDNVPRFAPMSMHTESGRITLWRASITSGS